MSFIHHGFLCFLRVSLKIGGVFLGGSTNEMFRQGTEECCEATEVSWIGQHQPSAVCWKDWVLQVLVTDMLCSNCSQFRKCYYTIVSYSMTIYTL